MSRPEVDGLNAGYAALLLEAYLENPSAVPPEWRALFESAPEELLAARPGLAILIERLTENGNGHALTPAPPPPASPPPAPAPPPPPPASAPPGGGPAAPAAPPEAGEDLGPAIAAAMSLVTSIRSHGHL